MAAAISQEVGRPVQVLFNEVPKAWAMKDAYCQLIPCNDPKREAYSMIPRLWAFEVTYKGIIVYSKLLTGQWPHVTLASQTIASMIKESNEGMNETALTQKYQTNGLNWLNAQLYLGFV